MIDLDELKRLAGLVTPETDPGIYAHARIGIAQLFFDHLPELIAALETARLVRDEDWLAGVMAAEFPTSSKMFPTWSKIKCKLSARAIIAALPKEEV